MHPNGASASWNSSVKALIKRSPPFFIFTLNLSIRDREGLPLVIIDKKSDLEIFPIDWISKRLKSAKILPSSAI